MKIQKLGIHITVNRDIDIHRQIKIDINVYIYIHLGIFKTLR